MHKAFHRLSKASVGWGAAFAMKYILPALAGLIAMVLIRLGHPDDEGGNGIMIPLGYFVFIGFTHQAYVSGLQLPLRCSEHVAPSRLIKSYLAMDVLLHVLTCLPFLIAGILFSHARFAVAVGVAFVSALLVFNSLKWYLREFPAEEFFERFRRGRSVRSMQDAEKRATEFAKSGEGSFFWGGVRLPTSLIGSHFCLVGTSGSGKTTLIRLLMQDVLPLTLTQEEHRAIVYDAKRDVVSVLDGIGLGPVTVIANPFDARCHAWAIHQDIDSPADAIQLAATLVPSEAGPNQYFNDAAIELLTGVVTAFILNRAPWTLRDVVCATRTKRSLRMVLLSRRETAHLVERHFEVDTTVSNVLTTMSSKLARFEPIAALWHATSVRFPDRSFSISKWAQHNQVLVLGSDDKRRESIDSINRLMLRRAIETTLSAQDSRTRRSWFFLDELGEAGRLEGIDSLLVRGRSKGAVAVIGIQDIDAIARPSLYGQHVANVILNQCGNKALLRLEGHSTAQWASQTLGEAESKERSRSTRPSKPDEDSFNEQLVKRESVLPSEFFELPRPAAPNGFMEAFFLAPDVGAWKGKFEAFPMLKKPGEVANYEDRAALEQYVPEWDDADLCRLGLPPPESTTPPAPQPSGPTPPPPIDALPRLTLPRH